MLAALRSTAARHSRCYATLSKEDQGSRELARVVEQSLTFTPIRPKKPSIASTLETKVRILSKVDSRLREAKRLWDEKNNHVPNIGKFIYTHPIEVENALKLSEWLKDNPDSSPQDFIKTQKPSTVFQTGTLKAKNLAVNNLNDHLMNTRIYLPGELTPRQQLSRRSNEQELPSPTKKPASPSQSPSMTTNPASQPLRTKSQNIQDNSATPSYLRDPDYVLTYNKTDFFFRRDSFEADASYKPIKVEQTSEVPTLKHSLSRVLFSPGVHFLQDPRTKVFNFDPYLQNILPVNEFDFQHITQYVTSEKDQVMLKISKMLRTKYYSSTSSMTGVLSQMHFLLSNFRPVNYSTLSRHVPSDVGHFTKGSKLASSVIVRKMESEPGIVHYAIDSDKSSDKEIILSKLGHSLERLLTSTPDVFDKYKLENRSEENSQFQISQEKNSNAYHYATMGDFLMRSQLDCKDERLPGTGTFDLKTRAVCAVRHDVVHHETQTTGYELNKQVGEFESFEREFMELARSTLLKYSLQARIGNMDGIFVAYHNIAKIFGFQYLPLSYIDKIIHSVGQKPLRIDEKSYEQDPTILELYEDEDKRSSKYAQDEFTISMKLYQKILNTIINDYLPDSSFRLIVKAMPVTRNEAQLIVIAHPVTDEEIDEIQSAGKKYSKALKDEADAKAPKSKSKKKAKSKKKSQSTTTSSKAEDKKDTSGIPFENTKGFVNDYVKYLEKMNDRIFKSGAAFLVVVDQQINEQRIRTRHPSYTKITDDLKVDIKIKRFKNSVAKEYYKTFLQEKSKLLLEHGYVKEGDDISDYVKLLRALGDKRKSKASQVDEVDEEKILWNKD